MPNHTSNKHEWFKKSVDGIAPYDDYFVWRDGKGENNTEPPTNWVCFIFLYKTQSLNQIRTMDLCLKGLMSSSSSQLSVFSGPGWTYNKKRKQFYFHQFYAQQPDLNYRNEAVQREMEVRPWDI